MKLLKAEIKANQQKGRRRIKMLHDLANDVALLHSNGQLRTESYGNRERMSKTCCTAEDY